MVRNTSLGGHDHGAGAAVVSRQLPHTGGTKLGHDLAGDKYAIANFYLLNTGVRTVEQPAPDYSCASFGGRPGNWRPLCVVEPVQAEKAPYDPSCQH